MLLRVFVARSAISTDRIRLAPASPSHYDPVPVAGARAHSLISLSLRTIQIEASVVYVFRLPVNDNTRPREQCFKNTSSHHDVAISPFLCAVTDVAPLFIISTFCTSFFQSCNCCGADEALDASSRIPRFTAPLSSVSGRCVWILVAVVVAPVFLSRPAATCPGDSIFLAGPRSPDRRLDQIFTQSRNITPTSETGWMIDSLPPYQLFQPSADALDHPFAAKIFLHLCGRSFVLHFVLKVAW